MSNGSYALQPMTSSLTSRFTTCLIGASGLLALARPGSAQLASAIDLSSRGSQSVASEWQGQLSISPFMRFDHPRLLLDARWTALDGDGQRLDGFGNVGATYFSPTRAGMQLSLGGVADRQMLNESFAVSRLGADARLSYRLGNSGAWLGREVARDNKSTPASPVPHYSAGAWRQWRGVIMTLSVSSFGSREGAKAASTHREVRTNPQSASAPPDSQRNFQPLDTITVVDSGSAGRRHDWRDAQLGLHWSLGRLTFDGLLGTRFSATNQPNETWGRLESSFALGPDVALITSTGIRPSSAAYGIARSRFVELGFRVSPSALRRPRLPSGVRPTAAAFQIEEAEHGTRRLRIRVPSARSVELSGDFTNWQPISLRHVDGDQWETTLAIAPGMHRVVIRVDGDAWTTPPGIASVQDEFQGTVGVIVIK